MKITGRHMDVTPALKRYIRARFERLERYDVPLDRLEIVLSVTKFQHTAEVVCSIRGKRRVRPHCWIDCHPRMPPAGSKPG